MLLRAGQVIYNRGRFVSAGNPLPIPENDVNSLRRVKADKADASIAFIVYSQSARKQAAKEPCATS